MDSIIDKMIEKLNSLSPMNEILTEKIRSLARIFNFNAGELILREGQVCNKACLVVKGLTRSYYLNDGLDITSRFMEEGSIVTSWPSYFTQKPGTEFIVAVEDTTMVCLMHNDIRQLYTDYPEFNINGRRQTEFAFYQSEMRTQLLRRHSAEEKYRYFLTNHPSLMQRVPLKNIATYLGMSEETLSRVRTRFHKNNA